MNEARSENEIVAALAPFGWTCGPDFWKRYYTDAWVFNLTNAVVATTRAAVVPSGLTAEKLRSYARLAGERAGEYDVSMLDMALTLTRWADALSTQETES